VSNDPNSLDLVRTKAGSVITHPDGSTTTLPKDGRWASDDFWQKVIIAAKFGKD